jgi:hypothetical protein
MPEAPRSTASFRSAAWLNDKDPDTRGSAECDTAQRSAASSGKSPTAIGFKPERLSRLPRLKYYTKVSF